MLKEFKKFAIRGNFIDMSIGILIGGAFSKIVTSFVNDVIMPLISLLTGKIDFTNLFISLDGKYYDTLEAAKAARSSNHKLWLFYYSNSRFCTYSILYIYFCAKANG